MIFSFLSKLLGGNTEEIGEAIKKGGTIIDVRSEAEFSAGNISGSANIPLPVIMQNIEKIKKMNQPLILCCASGARSAMARKQLMSMGIDSVVDGKSWKQVESVIHKN